MERRIGCAVLVFALAACNGSSSGSIPNVALQNSTHARPGTTAPDARKHHKKKVRIKIRIHVPNHKKFRNKRVRRRMTVSENTKGIQINAYAAGDRSTILGTVNYDISPASSNCTPGTNDARTCSFFLEAPAGSTDFVATTWDVAPPNGGNFPAGNQLGYAVDPGVNIVAGGSPSVSFTLGSVLSSAALTVTPSSLHSIIPSNGTANVYALDADSDVILSNGFIDANGNSLSISLSIDNDLNGALYLATNSISAPSPNGVPIYYTGGYEGGSTTVNVTASAGSSTPASAAINAIDPVFTSITDNDLQPNNPYHGGIAFDTAGGVYYTTPYNFGGISYYSGSGSSVSTYAAPGSNPIRGGLTSNGGIIYGVGGSQAFTIAAPAMNPAPLALVTPAPIPNGSAMSYDSVNNALWYMAGSNLVEYFTISGNPNVTPVGVTADAGLSLDPTNHPWYVDNVNNVVCKYNGSENCYTLESGSLPFDILSNGNGTFITDHGTTPAILQLDSSGNIQQQITVPNGAVPWYMMADNAQPGIIWFDYLINGNQIGLARMDTNSAPPTFTMATDPSSPSGSQPGAIGTASNGLVYMVFENTDTLIQVQR